MDDTDKLRAKYSCMNYLNIATIIICVDNVCATWYNSIRKRGKQYE